MNTRHLLAVALVAALPLTACTDADPDVSSDTTTSDAPTDVATDTPTDAATDTPTDSATDAPTDVATDAADDESPGAPDEESTADAPDPADPDDEPATDTPVPADEQSAGSTPATAALFFDGQQVPVAEACNGADGAVRATTEGEVTIQAVLEGGETAMRYMAEGEELYIEDVTTSEAGATTVYEGTFEPAESEPLDVRFEVGDRSQLDDCP